MTESIRFDIPIKPAGIRVSDLKDNAKPEYPFSRSGPFYCGVCGGFINHFTQNGPKVYAVPCGHWLYGGE